MYPFDECPIIVPIDLSPEGIHALECAKHMTADPSRIVALHVCVPAPTPDPPYSFVYEDVRESVERQVHDYCKDYANIGIKMVVDTAQSPSDCIVHYAEKVGAGLIVMPSHGRTGMNHMLIGSVAERVVRHARCPVLVLRGLSKRQSILDSTGATQKITAASA